MAIWAHQYHTHQHISPSCGKIYYEYGRSFGFAIVGWMTCFFNILLRILARSKFAEAAGPGNVYTASAMEELPPAYKSM